MLKLYENIKKYRKEKGLTQSELAKKMGYADKSAISKIESGKVDLPQSQIIKFAKALGVDPRNLMDWGDKPSNAIPMSKFHMIPLYSEIAGGVPIEMNNSVIDHIPVYGVPDNGEYFALTIRGHSMEPKIMDGDTVVVHSQNDAENGDVVVISIDGENATCKRLYKYSDHLSLLSFNSEYEPMEFTSQEVQEKPVRIYGKVEQLIRHM